MLILYPETLLKQLSNIGDFWAFKFKIMPSVNRDNLVFPFPIWVLLISFSYLIVLARTSGAILNKSGENVHPCLVPVLRENACNFSTFNKMLAMGLS